MFRIFEEEPVELSITEGIALLSFVYLLISSAFNTGYFNNVPGHFVELFTLQDLFATNLPIIEYIFSIFFIYSVISVLTFWKLQTLVTWIGQKVERFSAVFFQDAILVNLGMLLLIIIFHLLTVVVGLSKLKSFTLLMLPSFIFHGIIVYVYIAGWRAGALAYKSTLWILLLNIWVFSYVSGAKWVQSEIANPQDVQSFQTKDGACLDRKLMRSAGGGLLLYNVAMKQFEIRARDDFRSIFPSLGCI